jgi:hypothetical protein
LEVLSEGNGFNEFIKVDLTIAQFGLGDDHPLIFEWNPIEKLLVSGIDDLAQLAFISGSSQHGRCWQSSTEAISVGLASG